MINNKNNLNKTRQSGQVMLITVFFFMLASMIMVFGVINPILKQVAISKSMSLSMGSYFLAQSALEDVYYRLKNNMQISGTESLSLNDGTTVTTVSDTVTGKKIVSSATVREHFRRMEANLVLGTGASFHYGVQVGNGGFVLENYSSVTGNIHSSGPIIGSNNNIVRGDVISSGPTGLIDGVHATGSAYSNTISDSIIDKNAYYVSISGTSVGGNSYPNSPDPDYADFPIPDEQINQWESDAEAGGTVTCSNGKYSINSDETIGPIKVPCDLEISGSPTVTIAGPVWVTGDISMQNSAEIIVSSSLGNNSVPIIADDPSNRTTGSTIDLRNTVQFFGSGLPGSFIFLISQNNSAELGGSVNAISMDNSSSGSVILYASHGLITINNSATLKEVTAYKIVARNSATIIYDTGLISTLFSAGPGGGYEIVDWREVE